MKKNTMKKQTPSLIEITEAFSQSLLISNLIHNYIVKNESIRYNESLLKKATKAHRLISDIHQSVHLQFAIKAEVFKDKVVETIVRNPERIKKR
jgi:hypothetical protein